MELIGAILILILALSFIGYRVIKDSKNTTGNSSVGDSNNPPKNGPGREYN